MNKWNRNVKIVRCELLNFILSKNLIYSKARKRDRECMGNENERKLYLQDPLLELRIPENEINFLTDLPGGLEFNEWIASHSK